MNFKYSNETFIRMNTSKYNEYNYMTIECYAFYKTYHNLLASIKDFKVYISPPSKLTDFANEFIQ